MSQFSFQQPIKHIPKPKEYLTTAEIVNDLILSVYPQIKMYLWDYYYYYIGHEDWGKVFEEVLLNQPKYLTSKMDCENFAMLASSRVNSLFQINTCGLAIGQSPQGQHGYNLFISRVDEKPQLFLLEPQTGMIYPMTEPEGYIPELVIFS
uniref:Agglutinin C-terminal domain-containing protein n=1 Tax=viral metagenome TaxID=1070528 RepID=A0A6M3IHP6_9ZZZZ